MNNSIYEEAKVDLTFLMYDELEYMRLDMFEKVKQALEKAQKQEKLLKLYQKLYKIPRIISTLDEQLEIEKLIKELEDDK